MYIPIIHINAQLYLHIYCFIELLFVGKSIELINVDINYLE